MSMPSRPYGRTYLLGAFAAAGVAALIGASFLVGGSKDGAAVSAPQIGNAHGYSVGVGARVPQFTASDVITGRTVTSRELAGRNVLYYFSQGVGCQACMAQIAAFEQKAAGLLKSERITLVSVTNDDAGTLREAAPGYGITTPLLADPSKALTQRFGAMVNGMHGVGADHMFIFVDRTGHIRFMRDYPSMWVEPAALLKELPGV